MSNNRLFIVVIALALVVLGAISLRPAASTFAVTLGTHEAQSGSANLPFGPELAATYGRPNVADAALNALPFGPELAATYGSSSNSLIESTHPLPFGPGIAATYGVPSR